MRSTSASSGLSTECEEFVGWELEQSMEKNIYMRMAGCYVKGWKLGQAQMEEYRGDPIPNIAENPQ